MLIEGERQLQNLMAEVGQAVREVENEARTDAAAEATRPAER